MPPCALVGLLFNCTGSRNGSFHFTEGEIRTGRAGQSGTKGESRLESQPWAPHLGPCPLGSPSTARLQGAAVQRSVGLGDPPDGAGTTSLFVLLEKPGEAWVTSLREDAGTLSLTDR